MHSCSCSVDLIIILINLCDLGHQLYAFLSSPTEHTEQHCLKDLVLLLHFAYTFLYIATKYQYLERGNVDPRNFWSFVQILEF